MEMHPKCIQFEWIIIYYNKFVPQINRGLLTWLIKIINNILEFTIQQMQIRLIQCFYIFRLIGHCFR